MASISTYSPMRNASSSRKKNPEMTSLTSVWAPKPIASPSMPAPASSGPMFTPSAESTIITTITLSAIATTLRSSGSRVATRDSPGPPISISPESSSASSFGSSPSRCETPALTRLHTA